MTTDSHNKPKVLIVDDDVLTVELIAQSLGASFDISFALNAADGLSLAKDVSPDIILLDVMLPDMKGYDVCKLLKSQSETYRIPVIFVTSRSEISDKTKGFALGAVDFVTKPIELPVLKARIKTHVRLKRNLETLEELSLTDPLTDLANKRHYKDALANEWKRASRARTPLSLMVVDVDDFKKFNDNYGHGLGDECLVYVTSVLKEYASRASDIVARIGGEEFAVLMPDTDEAGAQAIAESILCKLKDDKYKHEFSSVTEYLTVSIGIATHTPSIDTPEHELFSQADKALYKAKTNGKNQFQVL